MSTPTPRPKSKNRSDAFDPGFEARASRAKTKSGKDAGRVNGSAIGPTEDVARRRFAAASVGLKARIGCGRPLRKETHAEETD